MDFERALPTSSVERNGLLAHILADMRSWCVHASWIPRVPVLGLLTYWAVRHIGDAEYSSVIGGLNFGVHELGHVVFAALGELLGIAGGTILQCAAPVIGVAMFLRQRDYFAIAFALGWFATNLYSVALYVEDARARVLPLVGLGNGEPIHDWHYLLGRFGMLGADTSIASLLRVSGALTFAAALGLGGWLLLQMWSAQRGRGQRPTSD